MAAAFALALAVRFLVPMGFMPAQTPHGLVAKICGGENSGATVAIDLPTGNEDRSSGHQPQDKPCAFSALSAPALHADAGPAISSPNLALRERVQPPPTAQAAARPDFVRPPLRGPPALS